MRLVVALLLASALGALAAPAARAVASPGADHSCCPDPVPDGSTAPCQYLAALGCCEQVAAPPGVSVEAPRVAIVAAALPAPTPVFVFGPPAPSRRDDHGPPQAPLLRAVVLQL